MKIENVIGFALSSPYGDGVALGHTLGLKSVGLVEVITDDGVIGIGETYAGVYAPELVAPIADFLKQYLVGIKLAEVDDFRRSISYIPFVGRNGIISSVLSAIDIALWDIRGKIEGKPVWAMLSESRNSEGCALYASAGSSVLSPKEIESELIELLDQGFGAFKMRVGIQNWQTDLERVATARRNLGSERHLMIDAIMGTNKEPWDIQKATARATDLATFDPYWLEEPLHPGDVGAHARLREDISIPIASGEALTGMWEFSQYLDCDGLDIIQPDVSHCGGMGLCRDVVLKAREKELRVAMHVWGSPVAFAANAQMALAFPEIEYLEVPSMSLALSSDIESELWPLSGARLEPTDAPGLGVSLPNFVKEKYSFVPRTGYRL